MHQRFDRPTSQKERTTIFMGVKGAVGTDPDIPYIYKIPCNASFLSILCVGGGGGGGGGGASAAATASGGGEGGGCSGITKLYIQTCVLPSVLYCFPGMGGTGGTGQVQGGAAASAGTNGLRSRIALSPYTNVSETHNYLIRSGGTAPSGGQAASGATAGTTAGTAGVASGSTDHPWGASHGIFQALAGNAGTDGGSAAAGTNYLYNGLANLMLTGGMGGGGTNAGTTTAAGGGISSIGNMLPALTGGAAGGGRGTDGMDHIILYPEFNRIILSQGGAGGGSNTSTLTGGAGGHGGPGSGGGGGGGTNGTASVGGAGADGGPGFIIIQAF